jgi:flagellar biosynthesis/type III secretory pathway protein FliH
LGGWRTCGGNRIANVMGPNGVASGNTNNIQIRQQTLNLEDPRISGELAELRKALSAEADDDAAIEAGNIASAQKALKSGNEGGFRAAMKQLGAKTWAVAEKLALAWMTTEGRHLLGLPPG